MQYLTVLYGNMRKKMEQLSESEMMELSKNHFLSTQTKNDWCETSFIVNSDAFGLHPPCFLQKNSIFEE